MVLFLHPLCCGLSVHPLLHLSFLSVSLRGGLFDLLPAPLFWPQSSNPPPRLPKHLRVWQVREWRHSPDTSPLLFHLPLCSCSLTSTLALCVPHRDTLLPPPPSSVIVSRCFPPPLFPSALTFNCGPVLPYPPIFIPSSPLSGCSFSLYPSRLFLFCPFLFLFNLWQLFDLFTPFFLFLSLVPSVSRKIKSSTCSSLLPCFLYSVFPQRLRSLAQSFECFFRSLRMVQRRPSGSHPLLILTSQAQMCLLHLLSSLTTFHLRPFFHSFKSCTKCLFWFFRSCVHSSTAEEHVEAESTSTSGIMCMFSTVQFGPDFKSHRILWKNNVNPTVALISKCTNAPLIGKYVFISSFLGSELSKMSN